MIPPTVNFDNFLYLCLLLIAIIGAGTYLHIRRMRNARGWS